MILFGLHALALYEKEIRCKRCRRLLMKGEVLAVEIKCPKCGYLQTLMREGGGGSLKKEAEMKKG